MATAREEPKQQPYEGGGGLGGAGGKFRKRPFRRTTHTTPYDRPPTAFRNPNGGWLSKLVDPAQRLISSSAHRLFSTVFRKRLPPPHPPSPVENSDKRDKQQEAVATDFHGAQKQIVDLSDGPSNSVSGGKLTELEQILKQKTFTRSEIDRLTALLHSRTVDVVIEDQEKRSEVVPLKPLASADRLKGFPKTLAPGNRIESEGFLKTPAPENWSESQLVSTPVVSSTVLEGDVASPTDLVELAKSYMHKRPTSPSMLGFRSQPFKENSSAIYTRNLTSPPKVPITPLVPRTSGHEARENVTYDLDPYIGLITFQAVENAVDVYAGPSSSSQHVQDQSLTSISKQGALKRRSSVMDNDIGSFGAIRRIRQKPNLLSSRGLSLAVSGSPLSSSRTGLRIEAAPSISKPVPFGEPVRNSNKPSTENGDNSMPYTTVPTKSSEMASKILQQLDKLVSPKDKSSESKVLALMDKSPSKLSPSMLRGQALKSLENVNSSKFLGDVQDNKKMEGLLNKIIPDAREFTSQKEDKVKENGPLKLVSADDKFTAKMNGIDSRNQKMNGEDSTLPKKDAVRSPETFVPAAQNSVAYPPQKKRAFQMSAPEDFLDLDDDSYPNGDASDALAEGREKVNFSLAERKSTATEHVKLEKASAMTEMRSAMSEMNRKHDMGNSAGSMTAEKSTNLIFQSTSSPSMTVMPTVTSTGSTLATDGATFPKESYVSPTFNIGDKIAPTKDTSAATPIFSGGLKSTSSPILSPLGTSSDLTRETSSNLFAVAGGATDGVLKLSEPDKADNKNNPNAGVFFRTPETMPSLAASTSSTSILSFGKTPPGDFSLKNGSSASASSNPEVFGNLTNQNSSTSLVFTNSGSNSLTSAAGSSSLSTSTPALSGPAAPVVKFGSSKPSTAAAPVSETSSASAASVFKFSSGSTAVAPVSETSSAPAEPVKFVSPTTSTAAAPVSETSSAPGAPVSKFGSSVASNAFALLSQTSDVVSEATKIKQDTSFGNSSSAAAATTSTASTLFGLTASAAASTSANQSQGSTSFATVSESASGIQTSPAATGVGSFSQSIPLQFGSLASSPTFALAGSTTFASGSSPFGSTFPAKHFSSGTTPGLGSSSSLADANSVSSSSSSTPSVFGSSWNQTPKSPVFSFNSSPSTGFSFGASSASTATGSSPSTGFSFNASSATNAASSSSPSTGFPFGASFSSSAANSSPSTGLSFGLSTSSAATNSSPSTVFSFGLSSAPSVAANSSPAVFGATTASAAPTMFGSSNGASSGSLFPFNSSSTTTTQPVFGNLNPTISFGAPSSNNDQMNMEDSMAEDTVQASGPTTPVFGQQPVAVSPSPSSFVFGSAASSVVNPFQFASQPNIANPQNPSLFQASGSLGLVEGNFSMGSNGSGVDKSNRKYVKVKHKQRKK
ncbi:hypothetical protein L484_012581 [Morus notabilis]|uniref:Nuclear pore complex protein n=1 Tax=Morus notabilis TaxID=981085 RepID=W9QKS5_9ROSA|nr:hypothetical protein L484_012581 [Morus notabilis]